MLLRFCYPLHWARKPRPYGDILHWARKPHPYGDILHWARKQRPYGDILHWARKQRPYGDILHWARKQRPLPPTPTPLTRQQGQPQGIAPTVLLPSALGAETAPLRDL